MIEELPDSKIKYVIQFTKFINQQDSFDEEIPKTAVSKRCPLGFLKGKAKVSFSDDWAITDEELLGL